MTRQKTLVRQHQIIEAARNLIAAKGMDGVTIDAIAEEVGLTEGGHIPPFRQQAPDPLPFGR